MGFALTVVKRFTFFFYKFEYLLRFFAIQNDSLQFKITPLQSYNNELKINTVVEDLSRLFKIFLT